MAAATVTWIVGGAMLVLLMATTLFMKLISWAHVHRDLRLAERESSSCDASDLDAQLAKFSAGVQDTDANKHYPDSVSLRALLYFVVAPTLFGVYLVADLGGVAMKCMDETPPPKGVVAPYGA